MNTLNLLGERYLGSLLGMVVLPAILLLIVVLIALKTCDRTKMTFLGRFMSFSLETERSQPAPPLPSDEAATALQKPSGPALKQQ